MSQRATVVGLGAMLALFACSDAGSKTSHAGVNGGAPGSGSSASNIGVTESGPGRGELPRGGSGGVARGGDTPRADGARGGGDAGRNADVGNDDAGTPSDPRVQIDTGTLRGTREGATQVFRGIPYAAAPVGVLRLAPPQPTAAWSGERDASQFGPVCPQTVGTHDLVTVIGDLPVSEDCLSLNVFAPAEPRDRALPVMVFIHGGSFVNGSGADYDGRRLSEAGDVVVVTLNYRLGALAALIDPALSDQLGVPSGNLAIRDQQAALSWVQRNIAGFAGDPSHVTLFGESAGAASTCIHMFAKDSRTLAHRFILESGACIQHAATNLDRTSVQTRSDKFVSKYCGGSNDVVACLRALDLSVYVQESSVTMRMGQQQASVSADPLGENWFPQVDGVVLQDLPLRLIEKGDFNHGEALVGTNAREMQMLRVVNGGQGSPNTVLIFDIYFAAAYPGTWVALSGRYLPASDADALDSFERLTDTTWLQCPVRAVSRALSAKQSRVFMYSFEVAPAVHTQELDYVFGLPLSAPMLTAPPLEAAAPNPPLPNVVRTVQSYWVNFARTGDPNGDGLTPWPSYEQSSDQHVVLDEQVSPSSGLHRAECDEWEQALSMSGRNN